MNDCIRVVFAKVSELSVELGNMQKAVQTVLDESRPKDTETNSAECESPF